MAAILNWNLSFDAEGQLRAGLCISLVSVWILVGVCSYLNYYTRRRYFSIWTVAWLFYAAYLTLCYGLFCYYGSFRVEAWWATLSKQWAISIAAVYLLWGSLRFLGRTVRQVSVGLFLCCLLLWSAVANYPWPAGSLMGKSDHLWLQMPIFTLLCLASLVTVWGFFQYRRKRRYLGAGLLCFGFTVWAVFMAIYPMVEVMPDYMSTAFFAASVLQMFIAVNMIILVLEQIRYLHERRAARQLQTTEQEKSALKHRVILTEERYRHLFEQSHEPIVITTRNDLRIIELNPAAGRLLGLAEGQARERCLTDWFPHAECKPSSLPAGEAWFESLCLQRYHQLQSRDGRLVHVELAGSGVEFAGATAFQFYLREVTDRSRLEQQLRQAEKLSGLGQMVSSVAHELNSPLAVAIGLIDLALMQGDLPPNIQDYLTKAEAESQRAARLLANFLKLARSGGSEKEPVNVNDILRNVMELRGSDVRRARIALEWDLEPYLPSVLASADQMQQVIIVLLNNAMQAVEGSAGARRLRIASRIDPAGVVVTVEDSGPGVPPHLRARIFEPFFTTKPAGVGTGLGLSIAHSLMVEHRGRISCGESALGGALFSITLPSPESSVRKADRRAASCPTVAASRAAGAPLALAGDGWDEDTVEPATSPEPTPHAASGMNDPFSRTRPGLKPRSGAGN